MPNATRLVRELLAERPAGASWRVGMGTVTTAARAREAVAAGAEFLVTPNVSAAVAEVARAHSIYLCMGALTPSELVQAHLSGSRVVKVFNNIHFRHLAALARPAGAADRSTLALAGDDAEAKAAVIAFLDSIGYDGLDIGPLAEGWRTQRDTAAYASLYADGDDWGTAVPADAATVRERVAAARRYRDM